MLFNRQTNKQPHTLPFLGGPFILSFKISLISNAKPEALRDCGMSLLLLPFSLYVELKCC